jgi:branched-chain amino acid transport system ATP-binding protein
MVVTRGARAGAEVLAHDLLRFVKLERLAGEYAGNLSYGQQKLVEFVRMLMTDPGLILLDEPAAGVNRTLLNDLLEAVGRLRDRGKTVLLVEHDMKVVNGAVRDGIRARPRREDRRRAPGPHPGRRARH